MKARFWILFLIILALFGCKSQNVPLVQKSELVRIDTITEYKTDSIYISSKEYVRIAGDTVFITRFDTIFSFKWLEKEKVKIEHKTDSIPYKVEVVKEVRVRNGYDRFTARGFWFLVALLVAFVGWKVAKWYVKIKV